MSKEEEVKHNKFSTRTILTQLTGRFMNGIESKNISTAAIPENAPITESIDELQQDYHDKLQIFSNIPLKKENVQWIKDNRGGAINLYRDVADIIAIETEFFNIYSEAGETLTPLGVSSLYTSDNRNEVRLLESMHGSGSYSIKDKNVKVNLSDIRSRQETLLFMYLYNPQSDTSIIFEEIVYAHEENHKTLHGYIHSQHNVLERLLSKTKAETKLTKEFFDNQEYATAFEAHANMNNITAMNRELIVNILLDKTHYPNLGDREAIDKSLDRVIVLRGLGYSQNQIASLIGEDFRHYRKNKGAVKAFQFLDGLIDSQLAAQNITANELITKFELKRKINKLKAATIARQTVNDYDFNKPLEDTRPPDWLTKT